MTSREEYRRQQSAANNQYVDEPLPPEPRRGHFHTIISLALCLWVLLTSFWLYRTIFNEGFATREVSSTVVAEQLNQEVENAMSAYAVPRSVLTKQESVKLARQAVSNVYDNQAINLDLSSLTDRMESSVSSAASSYGVDVDSIAGGSLNALTNQLNSTVNQRVNTQQVKTFTKQLHVAKIVNMAALAISGVLTIVLLVTALIQRGFFPVLSWSVVITTVLLAGSIMVSGSVAKQFSRAVPDFSSSIVSVWGDVAKVGWHLVIALVVLMVIIWVGRIILRQRRFGRF